MRHYSAEDQEATRASEARRIRAIGAGAGTLTFASLTALVIVAAVDNAPSVHADELPQPPKVTEPVVPSPGPVRPIFDFADVQPWDPGKNGEGVLVTTESVATSRSAVRVAAAQEAAGATKVAGPVPVDPPNRPAPTQGDSTPPPKDDPLTNDGEFGDGCEQPGTRPRCNPKPPVVGLPEVEPAPVDEAEEPPVEVGEPEPEPVEDEPVVGLPEIVVETEVAE